MLDSLGLLLREDIRGIQLPVARFDSKRVKARSRHPAEQTAEDQPLMSLLIDFSAALVQQSFLRMLDTISHCERQTAK